MELITIKEYCKLEGISDQGARKRVVSKLVKSIQLDNITYIVDTSNKKEETIKILQQRLKDKNNQIRVLKLQKDNSKLDQEEKTRLLEKIDKLEDKIEKLHNRNTETLEKVISQYQFLLPSVKE